MWNLTCKIKYTEIENKTVVARVAGGGEEEMEGRGEGCRSEDTKQQKCRTNKSSNKCTARGL
jgi:hypothetical protein